MFQIIFVLLTILGILGCPYNCMQAFCAASAGHQKAPTCKCCQQHKTTDPAKGGDPSKSGCCYSCLCGGSLEKSPNPPQLDRLTLCTLLAADMPADCSSGTGISVEFPAPNERCTLIDSGREIRLSISSLLL